MQYFNIQVASQLSGVASATIRAWEKRYKAVTPERAENKHRLYSEKDIEKLALLYKLTEIGQSIGKIAHIGLDELKQIYCHIVRKPYDEKLIISPNHDKIDYEKILSSFHLALAAYKLDIISHELEKAKNLMGPRDLTLKIIVPLFQEIGHKVSRNELSIAQEHTLSAIVSFHMGQMIGHHYQKDLGNKKLFLITTPEGEQHEIGILASALLCVHYGVKFIFLGPSLPSSSLAEAANALQSQAILLGVTRNEQQSDRFLDSYLTELNKSLSKKTEILVGGNLKSNVRGELEKKRIPFFPSLQAFDEYLATYSH